MWFQHYSDSTLDIWDLKTGKRIHTFKGYFRKVSEFSISRDGDFAISSSRNHIFKVWDIKIVSQISAFSGDSKFCCGGFSPDNTVIVVGEASGSVHFLLFEK